MYCTQCGLKVSVEARFCEQCGSGLRHAEEPQDESGSHTSATQPARNQGTAWAWIKGAGRWVVRIVGLVLIVIIYATWRGVSHELGLESALMGMIRGGLMGLTLYGLWKITAGQSDTDDSGPRTGGPEDEEKER